MLVLLDKFYLTSSYYWLGWHQHPGDLIDYSLSLFFYFFIFITGGLKDLKDNWQGNESFFKNPLIQPPYLFKYLIFYIAWTQLIKKLLATRPFRWWFKGLVEVNWLMIWCYFNGIANLQDNIDTSFHVSLLLNFYV